MTYVYDFIPYFASAEGNPNVNAESWPVMRDVWKSTLLSWICNLCTISPPKNNNANLFTSHYSRNYQACNMFVIDWLLLVYIYQSIRHIFKLVDYFGSVCRSDWSESVRSPVRDSRGILKSIPVGYVLLHVPRAGLMDSEHVWEVKCPSNHYWGQVTQQNVTNSPVFLNFQISRISQRKNSEFEQVPRMLTVLIS